MALCPSRFRRKSGCCARRALTASRSTGTTALKPFIGDDHRVPPRQGFTEHSSQVPFQDYLVMGPGKSPMVVIYEAQFLAEAAAEHSAIGKDMVLLYPVPTLFTKHILLPISEGGARLGEALTTDPRLQELAAEHGLRTDNIAAFQNFVERHDLTIPSTLVNVIEPPSYEVLERMIQIIEQRYRSVGG